MTGLARNHTQQCTVRLEDYNRIQDQSAGSSIKSFVLAGALTIALFGGGSVYWAMSSKLDGAVVAPASLVVEGNRKTIEHLEGGIVHKIFVTDGDLVQAGQTLVELDSTDLDVNLDVLQSQLGDLMVRRARLLTQISGAETFDRNRVANTFRVALPTDSWSNAYVTQEQIFRAEKRTGLSERALQDQQVAGLRQQINGLVAQRVSNANQSDITRQELDNLKTLFAKGLVAAVRVNSRRIEVERLRGVDAALKTQEAQASNRISELMLTGLGQEKRRDEIISTELAEVEGLLASLHPQYVGARERLKRVAVTAPVSGRVVGLTAFTAGGVIRPGATILDIVPDDEPLVVEARVNTADIEKLFIGQSTRVRLSAFDQGEIPEATGKIIAISADSLEDERSGQAYYTTRVKLDDTQPESVASLDLLPGMPVDLFVNTGERTALSYLAHPLQARLAKTFIE